MFSQGETPIENFPTFQTNLRKTLNEARYALQFEESRNAANVSGKYTVHVYKVRNLIWINRTFIEAAVSILQNSNTFGARKYGTFQILELVGRNAVFADFQANFRLNTLLHVEHIVPYQHYTSFIAIP